MVKVEKRKRGSSLFSLQNVHGRLESASDSLAENDLLLLFSPSRVPMRCSRTLWAWYTLDALMRARLADHLES